MKATTFGRLTDAQRGLAESGLSVACQAACRAAKALRADPAECVDAGLWALVRAAALFDPAGGAAWNTYLTSSVTWEVRRRVARARRVMATPLPDDLPAREEAAPPGDEETDLARALARVPQRAVEAVRLHVELGWGSGDIGRHFGITARCARRLVNFGLDRIRRELEDGDNGKDQATAAG